MKPCLHLLTILMLVLSLTDAFPQESLNMTLLGHLDYGLGINEVRGAYHNGHEYALVGVENGLSIVDVTDPTAPFEVFFQEGPSSTWRDPFYHDGHAYCVTEGGGGLLIVDMSSLPATAPQPGYYFLGADSTIRSAHNMFIDSATDKAYLFGGIGSSGTEILDVSNPQQPVELGIWSVAYLHDGFVRNDTLWGAAMNVGGVYMVDVSDPMAPETKGFQETPGYFTHNVWPSDNGRYAFATDELDGGYVTALDMSDPTDIEQTDRIREPLTIESAPHNTHFINDYLVTSYYRDGVVIHDASDPGNIVLTGYFDTSPLEGGGYDGNWGVWPYLPSGNILVSDRSEGLFILSPTYIRAARIEGTVTEQGTGTLLHGAVVEILGTGVSENTNLFGEYATGLEAAGVYSVLVQKGGYLPTTINNVELINGQTVVLDIELVPDEAFLLEGLILEEGSGAPVGGATVCIEGQFFEYEVSTDEDGYYSIPGFYGETYDFTIGSWGHVGICTTMTVANGVPIPVIELDRGYHDDFVLDLGWEVTGSTVEAPWVRDVPLRNSYSSARAFPGTDVESDCGERCYVTGNFTSVYGPGNVGDTLNILASPWMDLTSFHGSVLKFAYCLFSGRRADGELVLGNDPLVVKVDYGQSEVTVLQLEDTTTTWPEVSIPLSQQLTSLDSIRILFEIRDIPLADKVKAGIDDFRVEHTTSIETVTGSAPILIYPNPATDLLNVHLEDNFRQAELRLLDVQGRLLRTEPLASNDNRIRLKLPAGVYLVRIAIDQQVHTERLVIQ